jgi:hypothetical protein
MKFNYLPIYNAIQFNVVKLQFTIICYYFYTHLIRIMQEE